ncbi:MAG: tRNA preQ1(34) S-adenosylmethionine ribosyltransferase-isomerase QueA [Planctomycetes bacterium]|nr:tRNA preQ1(34) S-adenosylmethionine ribosyltransferase-isomerase QueA [Planctomycetota bacterium]MCC7171645.1 tRNA preQ1(34) S-adenosylmethionine ribosyltransferase-isomerase QueA [Planctomycetota bacterium]
MTEDPDRLESYQFDLPSERIAQFPEGERGQSRLLVLPRTAAADRERVDAQFSDLPKYLHDGDLLVLNDTKVIPARVDFRRVSGGVVRGLLLGLPCGDRVQLMLEGKGRLAPGDVLSIGEDGDSLTLNEHVGGGMWVGTLTGDDAASRMLSRGRMPLPPYIKRAKGGDPRDALDHERYQTVFAQAEGAIAAPTAGLHFTDAMIARLRDRGIRTTTVTLHVGLGTFLPVRAEDLTGHKMHKERWELPESTAKDIAVTRAAGGRVVAVGTTVVRALESAARSGRVFAGRGDTDLFIRPPFTFRVVDALLTNFHLPKSTLLMLVSAFAGRERVLDAYRHAIERGYSFFSYGDAMLISDPP